MLHNTTGPTSALQMNCKADTMGGVGGGRWGILQKCKRNENVFKLMRSNNTSQFT